MAEITANFHGKDITITYPDSMVGKAEEAFVSVRSGDWDTFLAEKQDVLNGEVSDEQLAEWKYEFTVKCVLDYIKGAIKSHAIKTAMVNVEQQAISAVDEALDQINVEIEEESSGPTFV